MSDTFDDIERSEHPFWRSTVTSSSTPLTLEMLQRAIDNIAARERGPIVITTSMALLEGAGRSIGWPYLEARFEELARGAAHTIFANIALDVRATVTAAAAGRYAIGGEWPFRVAEWSAPQTMWD